MENSTKTTPMRIVHILTRFLRAGSEENTLVSCLAQVKAGHEVYIIHGKDYDPAYRKAVDKQIKFLTLETLVHPISPQHDLRATLTLAKLFKDLKPDVVHTHQSKAGVVGRIAARIAGVKAIVYGVHIVPFANVGRATRLIYLIVERILAPITDAFIHVSRGVQEQYLAAGIGTPNRHHIIHSGFELTRFHDAAPPEDWRMLLRVNTQEARPPILLMLAAFEPRKQHLEFLGVAPKIVARFPDVRILLAGDGKLRPEIEERVKALGLARNIILTGFRSDPERLIALADVCLLTSMREGLPRVIMQYLAGGKPVVASALPGLGEVLRHEVNGLIAPAGDMDAVADGILKVLTDETLHICLAKGAVKTDLSSWDAARMGEQINTVYHDVIRCKAMPTSPIRRDNGAP